MHHGRAPAVTEGDQGKPYGGQFSTLPYGAVRTLHDRFSGQQGGCNGAERNADRAVGYADHGATVSAPLMPFTSFLPLSAAVRMQMARAAHI